MGSKGDDPEQSLSLYLRTYDLVHIEFELHYDLKKIEMHLTVILVKTKNILLCHGYQGQEHMFKIFTSISRWIDGD